MEVQLNKDRKRRLVLLFLHSFIVILWLMWWLCYHNVAPATCCWRTFVEFVHWQHCKSLSSLVVCCWYVDVNDCRIPFKTYLLLAFLTVATMGLSNSSLGYLNYPTQVIFKCCKLIPVLIGGILIQGLYPLLGIVMMEWYLLAQNHADMVYAIATYLVCLSQNSCTVYRLS